MSNFSGRLLLSVSIIGVVASSVTHAQHAAFGPNYPRDVADFIESRSACDALRGDIPDSSSNNAADIKEAIDETDKACRGTDQSLSSLKLKYGDDPTIMQKLNSYDYPIERDSYQHMSQKEKDAAAKQQLERDKQYLQLYNQQHPPH
jgi:hypothetical protein